MKKLRERIDKLHDDIIDSNAFFGDQLIFDNNVENLEFDRIFSICSIHGTELEFGEDRLFGLNYTYHNDDSLLYVYAISHSETNKRTVEKMMKMIENMENKYAVLDVVFVAKKNSVTYLSILKDTSKTIVNLIVDE